MKLALGWPAGVNDLSALGGGPAGVIEGFAPYGVVVLEMALEVGVGVEVKLRLEGLVRKMLGVDLPGVEGKFVGSGLPSGTKKLLDILREEGCPCAKVGVRSRRRSCGAGAFVGEGSAGRHEISETVKAYKAQDSQGWVLNRMIRCERTTSKIMELLAGIISTAVCFVCLSQR
jgi:hypothetical protein